MQENGKTYWVGAYSINTKSKDGLISGEYTKKKYKLRRKMKRKPKWERLGLTKPMSEEELEKDWAKNGVQFMNCRNLPIHETEDGHVFFQQEDGTWTDHANPEKSTMSFKEKTLKIEKDKEHNAGN